MQNYFNPIYSILGKYTTTPISLSLESITQANTCPSYYCYVAHYLKT